MRKESLELRTTPNTPPFPPELLPGAVPSKGWGTARMARSPTRARSSFISAIRPQAQQVSKTHSSFGRREPKHPSSLGPLTPTFVPRPTSVVPAYRQNPALLEEEVHSASPFLTSVTQRSGTSLLKLT